jgi:hypothetical protein
MFEFEWPVDRAGYRWVDRWRQSSAILGSKLDPAALGPPMPTLEPCGGPLRFYRPLDEEPGLGRKFAALRLPADQAELLEFVNRYGLLSDTHTELSWIEESIQRCKVTAVALDDFGPRAAAPMFAHLFHPRFGIALAWEGDLPEIKVAPSTLYGAIILQIAQEIAGKVQFRKCKSCTEWFAVGKGGATRRKEFCSPRCRMAWHRRQSTQGSDR